MSAQTSVCLSTRLQGALPPCPLGYDLRHVHIYIVCYYAIGYVSHVYTLLLFAWYVLPMLPIVVTGVLEGPHSRSVHIA
jgi:hypothetical protein